ncbi:MAG TPA: pilus assembly protein PilM [Opitutaceae bacterium]|nr:pilus assembly protein PilM [Opitutaceae bacterium]
MRSSRILAVDVGAGHVACGVFASGATGRLVLQRFACETHAADPAHESRWTTEVAQALGALASRHKLGGACALAVPGHLALTKFAKAPSVAPEKRDKIVAFEAAESIPHPLEEVVWSYAIVADDGFDLEVMIAAVKFDAMQTLCASADAAGFPAERAIPAVLALRHAFRYNQPDAPAAALVLDVGARSTNLLFLEGERFFGRTLALGGNALTHAVAEELRIEFDAAETLKLQVLAGRSDLPAASPSRAAVQRAAASFAAKLTLEVNRSLINHRRQSGAPAPEKIFLAGGGAQMPELAATLAEKFRLPVERFDPLRHVDLAGDARAAGADAEAPRLANLVGLATRLVAKHEPDASLLPPALTTAIALRKRQPWLVAAAALVVLALLPPILFFHHRAEAQRERIAALDAQLMPLRAAQTRNEDNLRQIEEAKKQIAALRAAYATKSNWLNFFAELQERLVKVQDVWLDKLQVVRGPDAPDGAAAEANAAAAPERPPLRLVLSGRLLDVANPQSRVSRESLQRVKQLLASFAGSPFVSAVENERFDTNQNGLLHFDFTLVVNPNQPL